MRTTSLSTKLLLLAFLLWLPVKVHAAATGTLQSSYPNVSPTDSDKLTGYRLNNGTNQTVNNTVSNLFTDRILKWRSTGGNFRQRTNTASVLVVEFIDANGVTVSNVVYKTNGVPLFPNGASATLLTVGYQTVDELILTSATNTLMGVNSTGKVIALPAGALGAPLAYNTAGGGFTNTLRVDVLEGSGTGIGITVPTNLYAANLYVTNTLQSLASAARVQIDWSTQLAFYKHFTNATGINTNLILQLTNILDAQEMKIRIPGSLGSSIASNYSVTVSAPSGYKVDWRGNTTNGVNDFLVTSNKVAYLTLEKWIGTNLIEARWDLTP